MLKFIGSGSAFNTKLGNNSAFIKKDKELLLFDCGSSIFERIIHNTLLDGIEKLYILITHLHPDHVGSLGDLIFYTYYKKNFKAIVIYPDYSKIKTYLGTFGICSQLESEKEHFYTFSYHWEQVIPDLQIQSHLISHKREIQSYCYLLIPKGEPAIYYSGDGYVIDNSILKQLSEGSISALYQDTSGIDYEGNPHLSITKLASLIPVEFRNKVWCMHLDEYFSIEDAKALGFNVVKNEFD